MEGSDTAAAGVPREGDILAGKYRVERVIGEGGMGIVVLAEQIHLKRRVAVKILRPNASMESVTRFLREAQAAAAIKSEHVARVIDVCETATGMPCLVMEYLEGRDLRRALEAGEQFDTKTAASYVGQACEAIAEAHAAGIVHRDIKPENLFLTTGHDGKVLLKVLDFGISKIVAVDGASMSSLTTTRDALGTPSYMSPEQVRSSANVDGRTDVWALGVVLYELVARALPFEASTASAMNAAIVADAPVPLRDRRPEVAPDFERIVMTCLDKDPDRRFAGASELARALADLTEDRPRRRPRTAVIALAAVLAVGGLTLIASRFATTARASEEVPRFVASAAPSTAVSAAATSTVLPVEPERSAPVASIASAFPTMPATVAPRARSLTLPTAPPTAAGSAAASAAPATPPPVALEPPPVADPIEHKALLRRK